MRFCLPDPSISVGMTAWGGDPSPIQMRYSITSQERRDEWKSLTLICHLEWRRMPAERSEKTSAILLTRSLHFSRDDSLGGRSLPDTNALQHHVAGAT